MVGRSYQVRERSETKELSDIGGRPKTAGRRSWKPVGSMAVKSEVMAETTNVLRGCALIVEGMFLLGNRPDLVDRLRRALRQRRRPTLPSGDPCRSRKASRPSPTKPPTSSRSPHPPRRRS